jgi:galactose mutarotase-like enzyme
MSVLLGNSVLSVRIANTGAEIKSIKEHATGIEYIWQSDPSYWTGAAPVLFPIIGGLKNGHYRYKGKSYSMPGHGIVRKADWDVVTSNASQATLQIASSAETKKLYPFDFLLQARFSLQGNGLAVTYEVTNTGTELMYFSIGSHPAFNVPFAGGHWENYYLHFSESECIERHFFRDGMTLNETAPIFDNSRQIFLTPTLFDRLAIILKGPASKEVSLCSSRNAKQVKIVTNGMPYLGLWAPAGAPFVCVEPWYGVPDNEDTNGEFSTKEGIRSLPAQASYCTRYRIEIV